MIIFTLPLQELYFIIFNRIINNQKLTYITVYKTQVNLVIESDEIRLEIRLEGRLEEMKENII